MVGYAVKTIGDLLIEEARFLRDVDKEVDRLRGELRAMSCFLEDADGKRKRDSGVENWVADVRTAAHQAEDLVESFALEAERGFVDKLLSRHNIATEIQLLQTKIKDIKERRSTYGIQNLNADGGRRSNVDMQVARRRRAVLHASDHDVVGMEDEKKAIVAQLFSEKVKRRAVVSIVGMGGLGKTTLAKKVYNDPRIKTRFDRAVWINVSQQYMEEELLKELVLQVSSKGREELREMSMEELEDLLNQSLRDLKYLIVMDDVWDNEVWLILKRHLPDKKNGSRVLITTRSGKVARAADPSTPPHELRFLDENESWELFLKKAFPEEEEEEEEGEDGRRACPEELEEVGRQMVGKCGGLPLALTVLGGLLSQKRESVEEWYRLARTIIWQEDDEGQKCMKILGLSYAELPQHLKWCFLYLGAFPEDMEIEVEKLIRLWIAEGFVAEKEGMTLEESAEQYLEELVERCLVQVAKRSGLGLVKCRIHDLLRELSIAEAQELNFLVCQRKGFQRGLPYSTFRRLSLHAAPEEFLSRRQFSPTPSLRTLLGFNFHNRDPPIPKPKTLLGFNFHWAFPACRLQLIRVIDLEGALIGMKVPEHVGDLANLRYLGLRKTCIMSLPLSLKKLSRLQFLDLRSTLIEEMPRAVWRIEALRQVLIPERVEPRGIDQGNMRALQVLETAKVGDWINGCLSKLTNLQTLRLTGIHAAHHRVLSAALPELSRLVILDLEGKSIPESLLTLSCLRDLRALLLSGQIVQVLRPPYQTLSYKWPRRLSMLTLRHTALDQDPLPSLGVLPQLRTLSLLQKSYLGKEMTCPRDAFPQLRTLTVDHLPWLERWTLEVGAMPRLKNLLMSSCMELKMLPQGLKGLASLEELTLSNMSAALQARVEEGGDDWHKIQHIPTVRVPSSFTSVTQAASWKTVQMVTDLIRTINQDNGNANT